MPHDYKMQNIATAGQPDKNGLTGKLLLAMPGMGDPRFQRAVIFICNHDQNGAMGLVINHILPGVDMASLLEQLNITNTGTEDSGTLTDISVLSGGPVETARGFILHSPDFRQDDTIAVNDNFALTGTIDALKAISEGKGPENMLFILGYSGWSPGQLDNELRQNAWLMTDADPVLVFGTDAAGIWEAAAAKIGIDPAMLSGTGGSA